MWALGDDSTRHRQVREQQGVCGTASFDELVLHPGVHDVLRFSDRAKLLHVCGTGIESIAVINLLIAPRVFMLVVRCPSRVVALAAAVVAGATAHCAAWCTAPSAAPAAQRTLRFSSVRVSGAGCVDCWNTAVAYALLEPSVEPSPRRTGRARASATL